MLEALPAKVFGLRPPADPAWILSRLRRRAEGFLHERALIREVEAGLALGYGDSKLMRDPMIYMQTRDFLRGRNDRDGLIAAMVESMKRMHDDQLCSLAALPIEWVEVARCRPEQLVERIAAHLGDRGGSEASRGADA